MHGNSASSPASIRHDEENPQLDGWMLPGPDIASEGGSFHSTRSLQVGGQGFGMSYADLVEMESCVIEASDMYRSKDHDVGLSDLERDILAIAEAVQAMKVRVMSIHEDNEDEDECNRVIDDEVLQGEARELRLGIVALLRQIEEREWAFDSDEDEDAEGGMLSSSFRKGCEEAHPPSRRGSSRLLLGDASEISSPLRGLVYSESAALCAMSSIRLGAEL